MKKKKGIDIYFREKRSPRPSWQQEKENSYRDLHKQQTYILKAIQTSKENMLYNQLMVHEGIYMLI